MRYKILANLSHLEPGFLKLICVCFLTVNCAPTYFSGLSIIKTFDGEDLTAESCTQERMDQLKILEEGTQKDSDVHSVASDMYQLMSEGYTLNNEWQNEINRVWKEHDRLQHRPDSDEKGVVPEIIQLNRRSFRASDKHIRVFEEAIETMESSDKRIKLKSSDEDSYLSASEHNRLSAVLTHLIADYFNNLIGFCRLLSQGYELTERGNNLGIQLEPLYEDYNDLLTERIKRGGSQKREIRMKEDLLDIIKEILYIQDEIKEEFFKPDLS